MKTIAIHHGLESAKAPAKRPASGFERLTDVALGDAQALKRLVRQLDPSARFDLPALQSSIRCGTTAVFVLRRRTRIVASATAVRFATPTGSHCRIEDVVVDERCRGKGLGRQIMTEVLKALERDGVSSVELTSRPARRAANALYQSLGFLPRQTNVYAYPMNATTL